MAFYFYKEYPSLFEKNLLSFILAYFVFSSNFKELYTFTTTAIDFFVSLFFTLLDSSFYSKTSLFNIQSVPLGAIWQLFIFFVYAH